MIEGQDLIEFIDGSVSTPSRTIDADFIDVDDIGEIENLRFKFWRTDRPLKRWITSHPYLSTLSIITRMSTYKEI